MAILYRIIHKIDPDKRDEAVELVKRYEEVERPHGAPPKRIYAPRAAPHDWDTLIVESEWESLGAMEEIYQRIYADPAYQQASADARDIFRPGRFEFYVVLK